MDVAITPGRGKDWARVLVSVSDITELKKAEERLRRSEACLREAQELAHIGNWEWDLETQVLTWSDEVYRIFGVTPGSFEPSVQAFEATIHPDDLSDFLSQREQMLNEKQSACIDHRIILPNGEVRFVQERTRLIMDGKGNLTRAIGTVQDITERKKVEDALRESEQKFRRLSDSSPMGIFQTDADGRVLYLNDNWCSLSGMVREEALGFGWVSAIHPEDKSRVLEEWGKCLKEKTGYSGGFRFVRPNGEICHMHTRTSPIFSATGDVIGHVGANEDITERKKAEEALRKSQMFNEIILNASPDVIYIYDIVEKKNVYSNEGVMDVLGYSAQEIQEMGDELIQALMHPDDFTIYLNETFPRYQTAEDNEFIEHEYRMKHKNGEWYWLNSKESIFARREDGTPDQIFGIIRDITERKKTEEALQQSKELLKLQFENSPDIILIIDKEFKIKTINRTLSGNYTIEELIGKYSIEILPSDQREKMKKVVDRCFKTGEVQDIEHAISEKKLVRARIIPIKDKGNIANVLIISTDITERKQLEEQLFQAQKMESLGRLAGGVAHDFNNILTTILGYAELPKLTFPDSSNEEGEAADMIIKGAERASDLIIQLLGFARGGKYNPVPLNINEVIKDIVKVSEKIFEKNIRVSFGFEKDIHTIDADKNQLDQILTNLFINARDAMPKGGELLVKTENVSMDEELVKRTPEIIPGNYVKISVTDTGTGMTKDIRDHVFEPFFTTKGKGKGTGLGLATVYGIVKNHDGYIYMYTKPGEGTTFTLYFPASEMEIVEKVESAEIHKGNATILVVDDEEDIRKYVAVMLKKLGYNVYVAKDGKDAINIYSEKKDEIDLVLLDIIMPEMAGRETNLKLVEINPDAKVILASGYSQSGKATEILKEGATGFIQKSFRVKDLTKIITDTLDKNQP